MKNKFLPAVLILVFIMVFIKLSSQDIILPAPDKTGGKPLMQALNERRTTRSFTGADLTPGQLSDLLWAAWGINRSDGKKRTAPSARNYKEISVYVVLREGLYLYEPERNALKKIMGKDIRSFCGDDDFVVKAPLNLIYVANLEKLGINKADEIKDVDLFWSYANTGFIAQNVYLYCASANLGCVVRGALPKQKLAGEMGLGANQVITLAQTVGVPSE
jgi:hypothetical protein